MESIAPIDVCDPEQAKRWADEAVSRRGRIDVLYNNAAGLKRFSIAESPFEDWEYTIRGELTVHYAAARAVWPHMVKQKKGVVISIASLAGNIDLPRFPCPVHGPANAGIKALARTLAAYGAPHGIRSVSISPGPLLHPNIPGPYGDPNSPEMRALCDPVPMGRPGTAQEVINVAMFLASDEASYVTGTDIAVDGGASGITWNGAPEPARA